MIGLVDYDFQTAFSLSSFVVPNLEIMKLATYYRNNETFCRLIDLQETALENYETIYFFSETAKRIQIPLAFKRNKNVIYGGTAFTNGIYKPFKNQLIDYTLPKPFIYKELLKLKLCEGIDSKVIEHILDDSYYRIMAGNNKLPVTPVIPKKRIYIYDRNIFYNGWQDIITDLSNRAPSSINMIHPIICTKLNQYFDLRNFTKIRRSNEIVLELDILLKEIPYMLKEYSHLFKADITFNSNVNITLGGDQKSYAIYYKNFINKLNLLYSFWSYGIPIKIKYIEPSIGFIDPLQELSRLAETWTNGLAQKRWDKSLFERSTSNISKEKKLLLKDEIFSLLKHDSTVKDLLSQTYNNLKERKYWRI